MKDFFSKCDKIHSFLQILSLLQKKSLMENFIFFFFFRRSKYIRKQSTAKTLTQLHYFKTFLSAYFIIRLFADVSIKLGM